MVHIHHRKKTPGGCIDRLARSGSCRRESVRGVVGTMNAAWSRPDWLATVQSGRKQVQSRVCTPGLRIPVLQYKFIKGTFMSHECIRDQYLLNFSADVVVMAIPPTVVSPYDYLCDRIATVNITASFHSCHPVRRV